MQSRIIFVKNVLIEIDNNRLFCSPDLPLDLPETCGTVGVLVRRVEVGDDGLFLEDHLSHLNVLGGHHIPSLDTHQ